MKSKLKWLLWKLAKLKEKLKTLVLKLLIMVNVVVMLLSPMLLYQSHVLSKLNLWEHIKQHSSVSLLTVSSTPLLLLQTLLLKIMEVQPSRWYLLMVKLLMSLLIMQLLTNWPVLSAKV